MAAASAQFWPVSLLIDVASPPDLVDPSRLWPPAPSDGAIRPLLHEVVHYWQALSQAHMVALAEEEWQRLVGFERSGIKVGPGPLRRNFDHRDPGIGWSARDLYECLARFWDVVAAGPNRVVEEEWTSNRASASADIRELRRQLRAESPTPDGAWDANELMFALAMVAGEYASPILSISQGSLDHPLFLFPWFAHFALQTADPIKTFDRFVREVGPKLANEVTDLLSVSRITRFDRFEATMNAIFYSASVACISNANATGDPVRLATQVFLGSSLTLHPVYRWAFRGPVLRTSSALKGTELVAYARQTWGLSPDAGLLVGLRLLERALATPGLPESRALLLAAGVVPPCIRYADGTLVALPPVFRGEVATWPNPHPVEVIQRVSAPGRTLDLTAEESALTRHCADIQCRWDSFIAAPSE